MTNGEGGRDPEESRVDYVMDRVNTIGTVWMGLTVGCAQCHTHKFDPISHKEYYQLNAFFNSIDETGQAGGRAKPYMGYKSPYVSSGLKESSAALKQIKSVEAEVIKKYMKDYTLWLRNKKKKLAGVKNFSSWEKVIPSHVKSYHGSTVSSSKDVVSVSGKDPRREDYIVTFSSKLKRITGIQIEFLPLSNGKFSRGKKGEIIFTNLKVAIRSKKTGKEIPVSLSAAKSTINGKNGRYNNVKGILDDDPRTGWVSLSKSKKPHVVAVSLPN